MRRYQTNYVVACIFLVFSVVVIFCHTAVETRSDNSVVITRLQEINEEIDLLQEEVVVDLGKYKEVSRYLKEAEYLLRYPREMENARERVDAFIQILRFSAGDECRIVRKRLDKRIDGAQENIRTLTQHL